MCAQIASGKSKTLKGKGLRFGTANSLAHVTETHTKQRCSVAQSFERASSTFGAIPLTDRWRSANVGRAMSGRKRWPGEEAGD